MIPDFSDKEALPRGLGLGKASCPKVGSKRNRPERPFYGFLQQPRDRENKSIRTMPEIIIFRTFGQMLAIKLLETPDQAVG